MTEWPRTASECVSWVDHAYALRIDDALVDPKVYARTAIPERVWSRSHGIVVWPDVYSDYDWRRVAPGDDALEELTRPHPNLQERFFRMGADHVVTDVIGSTRLLHNLVLLRRLGVARERIDLLPGRQSLASDYECILSSMTSDAIIGQVVFTFDVDTVAETWAASESGHFVSFEENPLLRGRVVRAAGRQTLIAHITPSYGTQLAQLVGVLIERFDTRRVLVFGACGGLAPELKLHEMILPEEIDDKSGRSPLTGNLLIDRLDRSGRIGCCRIRRGLRLASLDCIPAETRSALVSARQGGVHAVDLELGPLATRLRRHPEVRWGAALRVSDRPLACGETLGSSIPQLDARAARAQLGGVTRSSVDSGLIRQDSVDPALTWSEVRHEGSIRIREAFVRSRSKELITLHAVELDLARFELDLWVNERGVGRRWKDDIVRGTREWDPIEIDALEHEFRQPAREVIRECTDNDLELVANANGNLFWNLGHVAASRGRVYHHYREHPTGRRQLVVGDRDGLRLADGPIEELTPSDGFAVSGLPLVRDGNVVNLFKFDSALGRAPVVDYFGDLSHVLKGFRLSVSVSRRLFSEISELLDDGSFCRADRPGPRLLEAFRGAPFVCEMDPDDRPGEVRVRMAQFGYREEAWGAALQSGTFGLSGDGFIGVRHVRATLGHSVLATTDDPDLALLLNSYTDATRKGFTIEDTARLVLEAGRSLGANIRNATILSSSGDPRFIVRRAGTWTCLERDALGKPILFKGGIEYGLSSFLLVKRR